MFATFQGFYIRCEMQWGWSALMESKAMVFLICMMNLASAAVEEEVVDDLWTLAAAAQVVLFHGDIIFILCS